MEEIEKYLQEDEIILWRRSTIENIVRFINGIIIFIVLSFIFIPIFTILFFYIGEGISGVIIITVFLFADGVLACLAFYNYKKRKKRLHLTYKELKNYEEFIILTNIRFIRRNYYLNIKVDLSRYIFENVLEKISDIIFLKLENIKAIIVEHHVKEINFLFHDELSLSPFYIKMLDMDSKEINNVIEILTEILNLERVEQYPGYERFVQKDS